MFTHSSHTPDTSPDMPVTQAGLDTFSIYVILDAICQWCSHTKDTCLALNPICQWCLRTEVIRLTLHLICQWHMPVCAPTRFTRHSILYPNDVCILNWYIDYQHNRPFIYAVFPIKYASNWVIDERPSIPVWGSEIVFLRMELDECSSIIQDISKLPHFQKYVSHASNCCAPTWFIDYRNSLDAWSTPCDCHIRLQLLMYGISWQASEGCIWTYSRTNRKQ